jgi:glycerophosphoryl diester phosphodiesterase
MLVSRPASCLRVGHGAVTPGAPLDELAASLAGTDWDMVELDVLADGDRLVVAHDPGDLALSPQVDFGDALAALSAAVGESVRFDIDIKAIGYEARVAEAIAAAGIVQRTLVSTMEPSSLAVLRREAPELRLGLSVPLARRDYLAHPLTRPGAYAMLAYLRRVLPARIGRALDAGETDAIMAHWGTITPRMVQAVVGRGAELFVWTVDDPGRLHGLLELGVTGVITNNSRLFDHLDDRPAARTHMR